MNESNIVNWNLQPHIPRLVKCDSYKAGHAFMYPEAREMTAYIEARRSFMRRDDHRIVHFGTQYFVDKYLRDPITHADVDEAVAFYKTHNVGNTPYPFPEDLFRKIVDECDGYFPVRLQSLPEGTVVLARTPQVQITAKGEYARLVTFLETALLSCVWYMSTVATHSRFAKQSISNAFAKSVDEDSNWKLGSRLHDFGYRGCTSEEQAMIGGLAHLLSFDGTDTMCAAWASRQLNPGVDNFDSSIPATEHSVMTAWTSELDAVMNMVDLYGHGVFATVADSYDYEYFLNEIVPVVAPIVKEKGGFHVVRPDSGDPVTCVIDGLLALDKAYGSVVNSKGYKVINNAGIIQGDGIDLAILEDILDAVLRAGYSAENVAFGMGAGLLQKLNRDTCSYAMKLNQRIDENDNVHYVMKCPKTDMSKASYPGELSVYHNGATYVVDSAWNDTERFPVRNELKVIYDCGEFAKADTFNTIRNRVNETWDSHTCVTTVAPASPYFTEVFADEIAARTLRPRPSTPA